MQTQSQGQARRSEEKRVDPKEMIVAAAIAAVDHVTKMKSTVIAQDAARRLMEMAQDNLPLYRALTDRYLAQACSAEVNKIIRGRNGAVWYVKQTQTEKNVDAAVSRAKETAKRTLFDMVLPGGMLLRNATLFDIRRAKDDLIKQGRTMIAKGTFLGFVEETMVANKAVDTTEAGDVIKIAQLERMRDRAVEIVGEVFDD